MTLSVHLFCFKLSAMTTRSKGTFFKQLPRDADEAAYIDATLSLPDGEAKRKVMGGHSNSSLFPPCSHPRWLHSVGSP